MSPSDLLTVYFQWFQEICGGLHIIHSQGLVHNRIVPASLLMPEDLFSQANKKQEKPITALIHDFGLLDRPGEAINGACVGFTAPKSLSTKNLNLLLMFTVLQKLFFSLFLMEILKLLKLMTGLSTFYFSILKKRKTFLFVRQHFLTILNQLGLFSTSWKKFLTLH